MTEGGEQVNQRAWTE